MKQLWIPLFLVIINYLPIYGLSPNTNLKNLIQGNKRFVQGKLDHPNRTPESRKATIAQQMPFAVIVACSDSRVAPEIIFDQGIGDLFVVRVAGNVIGSIEYESIEYAVEHLKSNIIIVLGHQNCGAVAAVVEKQDGDIPAISELIEPSVKKSRKMRTSNLLKTSIELNAENMKNVLSKKPDFKQLVKNGSLEIKSAYYDLEKGTVTILKD